MAIATAVLGATTFAVASTTPPRSGPYCVTSCVAYPYTDVAAFVPRDYLWMYPAILFALAFVVLMAYVHHRASLDQKTVSLIALCFALIAAALITADYFIQLAAIQPSLVKGETASLSLFSQYNPHGIFIALEDAGYLMMSVAFLFAGTAFAGPGRLERALRWILTVGSIAAIAALVVMAAIYGADLEYRFEVAVMSIDWSVVILAGVLLAVLFARDRGDEWAA